MLVRVFIGRYAGDIREFPFHVAQGMLAAGTATAQLDSNDSDRPVRVAQPPKRKRGRPRK